MVVPAPELSSIDVAVTWKIGTIGAFRKGALFGPARRAYCGTSRTTGPLTGGGAFAGVLVCSIF